MDVSVMIVEDEELYADKMEMQLDKLGYHHLATVDNSKDALAEIQKRSPDLILMDINIQGDYDGIELADMIYKVEEIPIIFITSLQDNLTFRRAIRTNPIAFLTKPFNELQLQRSIELAISKLDQAVSHQKETEAFNPEVFTKNHFFIKDRQRLEKVQFDQIIYLEADGRYVKVVTKEKKHLLRKSLQELLEKLAPFDFYQTHRSYALNLALVTSVDLFEYVIHLGDYQVPLSKRNKDGFLKQLETIS